MKMEPDVTQDALEEDEEVSEDWSKVILAEHHRDDILTYIGEDSEMEEARRDLVEFVDGLDEGEEVEREKLIELLNDFVCTLVTPDRLTKRLVYELECGE